VRGSVIIEKCGTSTKKIVWKVILVRLRDESVATHTTITSCYHDRKYKAIDRAHEICDAMDWEWDGKYTRFNDKPNTTASERRDPKMVQIQNPRSKKWNLIDVTKGSIIKTSKTTKPFPDVEIKGKYSI